MLLNVPSAERPVTAGLPMQHHRPITVAEGMAALKPVIISPMDKKVRGVIKQEAGGEGEGKGERLHVGKDSIHPRSW